MADLDLSTVVCLENCTYTGGQIVRSGGSGAGTAFYTFAIPAIRLVDGEAFDLELDLSGPSDDVYIYSLVGPTVEDWAASYGHYIGSPQGYDDSLLTTLPFSVGPGIEDFEVAIAAGETYVFFQIRHTSGNDDAVTAIRTTAEVAPTPVVLNRAGGRVRSGSSVVSFEPSVLEAPYRTMIGTAFPIGQAFSSPSIVGSQPVYTVTEKRAPQTRDRLVFGGVDVTWVDDMATPLPDYQLVSPLLYGPATWRFPQFCAAFERPGQGRWSFLRKGVKAKVQRVLVSTGEVIKTDHIGVYAGSSATDVDGGDLVIQVGGWPSGLMAPREVQPPRFAARADVQTLMARNFESVGVPFADPYDEKGIPIGRFGGVKMVDHVSAILARCDTINDPPMTVMPDADGRFAMFRKDMTTIHGTAYLNDTQTRASLRRDFAEEPNRVYGSGVTPGGQRVLNAVYPGLLTTEAPTYPMTDDSSFGLGTENADTDTGDGISVMLAALQTWGYLDRKDVDAGLFDDDAVDAVELLQEVADLTVTGDMDVDTWAALFNANVNGASVWWSKIEPMASLRTTRKWKRNADGSIIGKNPDYVPPQRLARVDETIDMGVMNKSRMVRIAKARRAAANDPNWVGSIQFNTGALVDGEHDYGDAFTEADVLPARDLQPGMNLHLPHSVGGELLVHISGISVSNGLVTAQVDTRARDSRQVQEIIKANREARRDPARIWWQQNKSSAQIKDAIVEFDEVGGVMNPVAVTGGEWKVFRVLVGQLGMIERFRIKTVDAKTPFVVAVFGKPIGRAKLTAAVPNPLSSKSEWTNETTRDKLDAKHRLLYIAGEPDSPCGYFPGSKFDTSPTITGRWEDDAGFAYRTADLPFVYVAIYAQDSCTVKGGDQGRVFWNQEMVGS